LKKKGPKLDLDPRVFPPDPRTLDIIHQISYVIRCLEKGLSEDDISSLYMDDKSATKVIIDLVMQIRLIEKDSSGKWRRTDKARRLIHRTHSDGESSKD
jgi:hypothetical protein